MKICCGKKSSIEHVGKNNTPGRAYKRQFYGASNYIATVFLDSPALKIFGLIVLIYLSDHIA